MTVEKKKRNLEWIEYKTVEQVMTSPAGTEFKMKVFQVEFNGNVFEAATKSECRKWITEQKKKYQKFPKMTAKIEKALTGLRAISDCDDLEILPVEQCRFIDEAIEQLEQCLEERS